MENKKNNKLLIIIISIIIVLVLLLILVIIKLSLTQKHEGQELERVKSYTTIDDFKTIEEVVKYLDCKYIKQEKSKDQNYNLDIYMKIKVLPYTEDNSNEEFYNKLISYCAKVLKFDDFKIIDKENNITIAITCNKDEENIKSIIINGEDNYFSKRDSELQIESYEEIKQTNLTVQSEIINKLLNNNWRINEANIGTKDSIFNSYDIYFDEGVEVRKVSNKVFNLVFTDKYKANIVNNITTATSKEDIIKILGKPTFEDDETGVIGYKGKDLYVFFNDEKEVSIYPIEKNYNSDEFATIVSTYIQDKDIKVLVNTLKDKYKDYDKYKYSQSNIELVYSLNGIKVKFEASTKSGIIIYNNYTGKVTSDIEFEEVKEKIKELPYNIQFDNRDLVYLKEIDRLNERFDFEYAASMSDENITDNQKNDLFYVQRTNINESTYTVKFVSKDNEIPKSELKESINSDLWLDEYNFVYSIKNKGIYLYNVKAMKYLTLITDTNSEFKLVDYKNGILRYDDKSVIIKNN